jgi:phage/plasmid-associated DNA primase
LIQGAHDYPISLYSETVYKPFNPRDPMTKKLMITLRNLFPDDEPDTFEFVMHYIASGLDAKKKESLILFLIGNGSNGKSFLLELVKNTMGEDYAKKM